MDELVFPLAAVAVIFLLVIPGLTLLSRWVLARTRTRLRSWARFGSETTFAWLVAPTLLPVIWLTSSALHQTEPTSPQTSCLVDLGQATTCADEVILLGLLVVGMLLSVGRRIWRERHSFRLSPLPDDAPLARRVARIGAADPRLRRLRVVVVKHAVEPAFTMGWFRPVVVLDACFVADADDEMVHATLLHERAHIAGFDTLRGFLARLCLGLNPAARLLLPDFQRWQRAREAQCDGEAVYGGGDPLALAEGILRAVRFRCTDLSPACVAPLCGHDATVLKLRVALLMNGPPRPVRTLGHVVLGAAVLGALVLPHLQGLGVLEHFHLEVERLLHASL